MAEQDDTFALRCFLNNKRKKTDQLTREEAESFRVAALHLANYLTDEYKLQGDPKLLEAKSKVHHLRVGGANPDTLTELYKIIESM